MIICSITFCWSGLLRYSAEDNNGNIRATSACASNGGREIMMSV